MKKLTQLILVGIAISTLFVNCGSPSSSGEGFGAVDSNNNSSTTPDATTFTNCSRSIVAFDVSSGTRVPVTDITVQAQRYKDQYGAYSNNLIRMKFSQGPSALWINENWDLELYRWIASSGGSTLDTTPLSFRFERKIGNNAELIGATAYTYFNWAEMVDLTENYINQLPRYQSLPKVSSTSPIAFFNDINLLVDTKDNSNSYQVIRVVLRKSSNLSVARELEVLIPSFAADPARYNADSRHPTVLQNLHPLKGQTGFTQLQYQSMAQSSCVIPGAI